MNMVRKTRSCNVVSTESHALLLRLAERLHQYGTPAHRLEQAIENVAASLNVSVEVFSMPTGLFLAFQEGDEQKTHLLRVSNGELHLEKQSDLDELASDIVHGKLSLKEAHHTLDTIREKPARYTSWMTILAFGLCGASVARIIGGGWIEMLFSLLGGMLTGSVLVSSLRLPHLARLAPALASFLVSFLMVWIASLFGSFAQSACHLASVIILVPGLSLTIAMTELSTLHLVSGTARLAGACGVLLQLGFGLALGRTLGYRLFGATPDVVTQTLPEWSFWLAIVISAVSLLVLFRARPKDLIWLILAGIIAMLGSKWGVAELGTRLGPFLGALLVGLSSHLFARMLQRPTSIMLIPGILLLVPGSIGLSSISELMKEHTLIGVEAAFTMFMVSVSLVFGVLLAALILPPKRSL